MTISLYLRHFMVSDVAQFLRILHNSRAQLTEGTVPAGFCDHPPSEGLRSLKPARPLYQ